MAAKRADRNACPLVIAPASTVPNWKHEFEKWGGEWGKSAVVVSYGMAHKQNQHLTVILDEAHYAKNPDAQRTKAALALAKGAERAWLLSGTPMPNDPRELFPPIEALWPEILQALGIRTYVSNGSGDSALRSVDGPEDAPTGS